MELTPMREAGSVRFPLNQELNRVFDEFFGDSIFSPRPGAGWFPAIDIAEAENEIIIRAEIPGVDPKDITVTVTGDMLTIKGEKARESEEHSRGTHRRERSFGRFSRTITLPEIADHAKVKATGKDGVIEFRLPRKPEAQPRSIEVSVD
jgi:HSP20 family protein